MRLLELLASKGESVLQTVITAAKAGDMAACKLVLDRVLPRRLCVTAMQIDLPVIRTVEDAANVLGAILTAAVNGSISATDAVALTHVVDTFRKTLETAMLEQRVAELEARPLERA